MLHCLDTGYSQMLLLLHQNRTYRNLKPAVSLRDPDRVLLSALAGEALTDTALMNVGIGKPLPPLITPLNSNNPGDSSAGIALEGVDEVPTLVSPSLTSISPINDNYCVSPTPIQVDPVQLDLQSVQNMVFSKTQSVNNSKSVSSPGFSKTVNPVVPKTFKVGCVLSCCQSCSYCTFTRASTKERIKSRSVIEQNKACQRCMLCKSMSFCPSCSQCPQCCHQTECRGKVTKVLAYLASNGCKSSGGVCFERRLHPSLVVKLSLAFYNRLFLVLKPNRKWRPILDLSQLNLYLSTNTFKMETLETIRLSLQTGEWMTSLDFSDAYFHIPINQRSQKYLRFSYTIRPSNSQLFPLVCPQLPSSLQRWSRK